MLPVETNDDSPRPRRAASATAAIPNAPLWEANATPPGGGAPGRTSRSADLGVQHAEVGLNASFAPAPPPPGGVAFASRAGRSGSPRWPRRRGVGLSSFVSTGNKADLSGNDLLQFWEADPGTE